MSKILRNTICILLLVSIFASFVGCDTTVDVPEVTPEPTEEISPTPEPTMDPNRNAISYDGIVFSRIYGNNGKEDSVTKYSFIELYNTTENEINLKGLSVYYRKGTKSYEEHPLANFVLKSGKYYLIRCGGCEDNYDENSEVIRLTGWNEEWDVNIDNDEITVVLALSYQKLNKNTNVKELPNLVSYFVAEKENTVFDTGYVEDMSKSKYAVRTALTKDSGYQVVNLTKANTTKLKQILPMSSRGVAGELKQSMLNEVYFSRDPGVYSTSFTLSLSAKEGYTIYYTRDGSDPKTSSSKTEYTNPFGIEDGTSSRAIKTTKYIASILGNGYLPNDRKTIVGQVIKAYATNGTDETAVYTQTYFVSPTLVDIGVSIMSISLPKEDIVGEEGFYNNYYPSTNDQNVRSVALLELFDKNGTRRGYSNVELSISGHGSSGWTNKSMKIYYKKENNQEGGLESKLYYDLFSGYATNENGQNITEFSRLLIRNSGNDCGDTLLRDAFMQRASDALNVDNMAYAPTLVFLNGEFWGLYNARERYSGEYVESHYGYNAEDVAIIESDYSQVHTDTNAPFVLTSGIETDPDDFNELVTYIKTHNLKDEKNYAYVESKLDFDSLIDLFVARLYFSAPDFPENNIKVWRVRPDSEDANEESTKWHFTLLDLDFGLDFPGCGNEFYTNYFGWLNSQHCVMTNIIRYLLRNDTFKSKFKARCLEVTETVFVYENMKSELDFMINEREKAFELHVIRWGKSTGISIDTASSGIKKINKYILNRNKSFIKITKEYFG